MDMESTFFGELRMDLSPPSGPVYGGGLIEIELFGDVDIPEFARLFLVYDGSKQRQVTEAKIIDAGRLQAVIPDHEPPEIVALSLIVKLPSRGPCRTIAQDTFTYFLDQTCYLARYLADSVHELGALEDWDYIRGQQFSLADEDFPTLDERLTSAFQHLILPPTWNLLGDPSTIDIARETLFHFAARLGLSSFVTLLLEKKGAAECLEIRNKHDELAKNIARSKSYDGLADLITDPHAHGVIRWESTQRMTPVTTIKRHSFGTVTTSTEMHNGDFPPIEEEIEAICDDYPPPPPHKPIVEINPGYDDTDGIADEEYPLPPPPDDLDLTVATWGSADEQTPLEYEGLPPPLPPKPSDLYEEDYVYDEGVENGESSEYTPNEVSYFSPESVEYAEEDPDTYQDGGNATDKGNSEGILDDNLRHLHKISSDVQHIRQKDIARLKQSSPTEAARLSNSCPNLRQQASFTSTDTEYLEGYDSPSSARSRHGFAIQNYDAEFQSPLAPYDISDDLPTQPNNRSQVFVPSRQPQMSDDENEDDLNDEGCLKVPEEHGEMLADDEDDDDDDERSASPSKRPHSWHSVEKLNEIKPDVAPKQAVVSHKRSQSYQGDESSCSMLQADELTPEERAEQADTITSPSIRRVRRHNNNTFAIVGQDNRMLKARYVGASANINNNALDPDRRFTISEGTISDPKNFEAGEDSLTRPKPVVSADSFAPKPFVPPRPESGPASKNIVSRKLSFLSKMRNSTRAKAAVVKDRAKKLSDPKASSIPKQLPGDDNLTEAKDRESPKYISWNVVKSKTKKGTATLNAPKPQTMMITKPTSYGGSGSSNGSYYSGEVRVHGLPVRPNFSKQNATNETGKSVDPSVVDGKFFFKSSHKDEGDTSSLHSGSRTPPHMSHYSNNFSGSTESLDEVAVDLAELENDPDLMIREDEPEAWSVTVEKKLLSKMHKKDIKRQDNIFEFIQKERNFLTTLKIMQKIFASGMARELQHEPETIDKMFPQIDEFVEFTSSFVQKLDERQREDQVVSRIGDILVTQWSGENEQQMLSLFSEFCSKQKDIVSNYKDLMKNDKKFQDLLRKCSKNPLTRRRDIPGCILLVTQRITKYPVILKTLIENSGRKEHKADCASLSDALDLVTVIIKKVDQRVLEYEKQKKVMDIYAKMDSKSYATYKDGRKFTREDFYLSIPKLSQVGTLQWKPNTMKRPIDVTVVVFRDLFVIVQENNQRHSFVSVGQPSAVPLHKLIVREKAGEDSVLFLLSASSTQPEMYELVFQTAADSKRWMQWIRAAADACPEEDEGVAYQDVEEQRLLERKWVQANEMISELEDRDREINEVLQEKMKKFKKLAMVLERPEVTVNMRFGYPTYILDTGDAKTTRAPDGAPILQKAIEQVNNLAHVMCGPGGLNRHPSSVGEHDSGTYHTPSLPKRSGTFGGFDNGKEPPSPRTKFATMGPKSDGPKQQDFFDESKRDSGLIEGEISQSGSEQQIASYPSDNSLPLSRGQEGMLLPPTSDQISALAQLTHLLNECLSVATQQDTQVQKMAVKVLQYQTRRGNGNRFLEVEARRNQAKQTEMEQDLLKREAALKSKQEQWDKQYKRFQTSMEAEKADLQNRQQKLKQDEIEIERQQDEVKRAKDDCQRQMARLRDLQRKAVTHQDVPSHPPSTQSSNRNNSNSVSAWEDMDMADEYQIGSLGSTPAALSKSHSSLEGELALGDNSVPKESSPSPTYSTAGDYPRTFPGTGRRDQAGNSFLPQQHHHSVQPPTTAAATTAHNLPIHLQFSVTNQLLSGNVAPLRHSVIPSNLLSSSKTKHGNQQVIPSKLKLGALAGAQSSQGSTKPTFTDGIKSKLPFSHHKKVARTTNSSTDLSESKARSSTLTLPNNLKHSKSEANIDPVAARNRSASSPSPAANLHLPDEETDLERSNSASSNSSKEGAEKKGKKGKRRSWEAGGDKPKDKAIYL